MELLIEAIVKSAQVKIDVALASRDPNAIARIEDAVRRASAEIRGNAA
jgi:hypothetical protein